MKSNIKIGHIARHTPKYATSQGREAAIVDIAQDFLLHHLHSVGILDNFLLKGGTAIRKLYAGQMGRFSLDLDFSFAQFDVDSDSLIDGFLQEIEGLQLDSFRYFLFERRGKWSIVIESPFLNEPTLGIKLDVSPSSWLTGVSQEFKPLPIHKQYGFDLPRINSIRLEENIAEKVARLNRTSTARDFYDLTWIMRTPSISSCLDFDLIRHLSVLKIWVDSNGISAGGTTWKRSHSRSNFDPKVWLRNRSGESIDTEDIGALATPPPSLKDLTESLITSYRFLENLDDEERIVARASEKDRTLVIKMLRELTGSGFIDKQVF